MIRIALRQSGQLDKLGLRDGVRMNRGHVENAFCQGSCFIEDDQTGIRQTLQIVSAFN